MHYINGYLLGGGLQQAGEHTEDTDQQLSLFAVKILISATQLAKQGTLFTHTQLGWALWQIYI